MVIGLGLKTKADPTACRQGDYSPRAIFTISQIGMDGSGTWTMHPPSTHDFGLAGFDAFESLQEMRKVDPVTG